MMVITNRTCDECGVGMNEEGVPDFANTSWEQLVQEEGVLKGDWLIHVKVDRANPLENAEGNLCKKCLLLVLIKGVETMEEVFKLEQQKEK